MNLEEALSTIVRLQDKIQRQKESNETLRKHNRQLREKLFHLGQKQETKEAVNGKE